jgi:hypothetical protein
MLGITDSGSSRDSSPSDPDERSLLQQKQDFFYHVNNISLSGEIQTPAACKSLKNLKKI